MMKLKYKSLNQEIVWLVMILVALFLYFSSNLILVKGAETSSTTGATQTQQNTSQQTCICPELEENYSACLVDLIKTNTSLQVCMNVTYYSIVNQLYQEINNINNKITIVGFGIAFSIGISLLTLFKTEIIAFLIKIKKKLKIGKN